MKFVQYFATFAILVLPILAQDDFLRKLPTCAAKCFQAFIPSSNCKPDNFDCLCADTTFQTAFANCNAESCTVTASLSATNETYAACGIPIRDESETMIAVTTSIGALAVTMVILRLTDRFVSAKAKLGLDDLLIGLAGLASLFQNVPVIVGAMMFQCQPISFFWDGWKGETSGRCTVDVRLFGFIRGAIEIMLDVAILSLPLPMLARLQMSWKKKVQIISMFAVGFIIFIVSCLRLWALVKFDQSSNPTCSGKSSYVSSDDRYRMRRSGHRLSLGGISKAIDIQVKREDFSESDVELVGRTNYQ
ncbi:uncharacterized protein J4E92_001448 [Alternaria infectoria]|uniref:uncharacterized protein n=1 Tax=Alternaria infectoria TaxID=45303 RepID=UPI002220B39D|nr:uncharacterized protein J4E92_001448 [Alternaria infectoria]KAI4936724.1 hypothetical protein J4E92_001448 [Alternaria infectoria]